MEEVEEAQEAEEAPQPHQVDLHPAPESLEVEDHQEAAEDHREEDHQSLQQVQQQWRLDKATN